MSAIEATPRWDIFCEVLDNFGDAGMCWRLARQLANAYSFSVRLWVNDLPRLRQLVPELQTALARQCVYGVEVCLWPQPFAPTSAADVVLEAFACDVPETYLHAMAARARPPVWINLEYLSAESWAEDYHLLPSPHPRLALTKYFFFPGFSARSGGLLREQDLIALRDQFQSDPASQARWYESLALPCPENEFKVSLFAYPSAPVEDLLSTWSQGAPLICYLPLTPFAQAVARQLQRPPFSAGDVYRSGALTLYVVPFLSPADYDKLLWLCDLNFVRGEDSFVRAQWAARPMVWQIYPQSDAAHRAKLQAFLQRYGADLPQAASQALNQFWQAWNGEAELSPAWDAMLDVLPHLREQARTWAGQQQQMPDLAAQLVNFSQSKL